MIWPARFDVLQPETLIVGLFATSAMVRDKGRGEGEGEGREGRGRER